MADVVQLDEERWVRAAQGGDVEAFNCLVEHYQALAFNVAYRTLGDREEAADATQEAFLSAFRAVRGFRGGGSFRAWLLRIVVNACYDARRHSRRHRAASMEALADEVGEPGWADPQAADPEQEAIGHETRAIVEAALAELPEDQRIAITLVDVQGLSYEEAAQAMACPVGTVRSRLARGRVRVRDALLASGNLS